MEIIVEMPAMSIRSISGLARKTRTDISLLFLATNQAIGRMCHGCCSLVPSAAIATSYWLTLPTICLTLCYYQRN